MRIYGSFRNLRDLEIYAPLWQWILIATSFIIVFIQIIGVELFAKIFVCSLIFGMIVLSFYAAYETERIREKWRKEGKSEWQIRRDFYDSMKD